MWTHVEYFNFWAKRVPNPIKVAIFLQWSVPQQGTLGSKNSAHRTTDIRLQPQGLLTMETHSVHWRSPKASAAQRQNKCCISCSVSKFLLYHLLLPHSCLLPPQTLLVAVLTCPGSCSTHLRYLKLEAESCANFIENMQRAHPVIGFLCEVNW